MRTMHTLLPREQLENTLADRQSPRLADGTPLSDLIDFNRHEVSMRVLNDPELHQMELLRIFGRAWIVVGHTSEIPNVGDFVLRNIGEDSVVVTRNRAGDVSILLNACAHRGMEVCRADRGNTQIFKCPYHGWAFDGTGKLVGAPFEREMYGSWDKSEYGLRTVRVAIRHGVIFGNFDNTAAPLDEWMGEFLWYFDSMYGRAELEAIHAQPPRMQMAVNWKAGAEQQSGDSYHVATLHRAMMELGMNPSPPDDPKSHALYRYGVSSLEGHGIICLESAYEVFKAVPAPEPFPVGWFVAGQMFPGGFVMGNASRGAAGLTTTNQFADQPIIHSAMIGGFTPRGPNAFDQWLLQLIEKDAPQPVRDAVRQQATLAAIVADDFEAWQSMGRNAKGAMARQQTIKYNALLGSNNPPEWPGPALVHKGFGKDDLQWHFWLRWYDMMTQPLPAKTAAK